MLAYLVFILPVVIAMDGDQANIPHGYLVPHPCIPGLKWLAVGHKDLFTANAHDLNQFGKDFKAAGFKWTHELCMMDSDGDGRSNGWELGDDHCMWRRGAEEEHLVRSHPGINEFNYTCNH